jgi:uncharacterized damage-inducible protein DinB
MRDHFEKLFRHMKWADARVLESLRTASDLLKAILDLYCHVLGSEHVWLSRIRGETPAFAVWPSLTFEECARLASENAASYERILAVVTPVDFNRAITYRNSAGDQYTSSLEDILTHVAMHGSYHRGQIATALRASGETPVPTDYIAFARGAPAAKKR